MKPHIYRRFLLFLLMLGIGRVYAQPACFLSVTKKNVCTGETIQFNVSGLSPGTSVANYLIAFGDGNLSYSNKNVVNKMYTSWGTFIPKLKVYFSNGDSCEATPGISITVNRLPEISYSILSSDTQCHEGNQLCLRDSCIAFNGASIITKMMLWDDGTLDSGWQGGTVCRRYEDPSKATYSPELIAVDNRGCLDTFRRKDIFLKYEKIGPEFNDVGTIQCHKSTYLFTNQSRIKWGDVKQFVWDYGDSSKFISSTPPTTPELSQYWTNHNYTYKKNGSFYSKLIVKSKYDCIDSFTYQYAAINKVLKMDIVSTSTLSQCFVGNAVSYNLNSQFIPQSNKSQVYYIWNHSPPNHVDSGSWNTTHTFPKPGKYRPILLMWSPPCLVQDTLPEVEIFGPMARIENLPSSFIADSERYQSSPANAIHFTNNSDTNGLEKVWWVWDMDDAGNANSSNDTQNTNAGKFAGSNTNYSQDWTPVHQYNTSSPRVYNPTLRMWGIHKEYDSTISGYKYDTCYSENSVALALMKPDAHGMTFSGQQCFGPMPPYGITFNWSKTKPGATQQFVSMCFDSACCSSPTDPACWSQQSSFSIPQWKPFSPFLNSFTRPYYSLCDKTGKDWVTVGLAIKNGNKSDTVWYHHALRFVHLNPKFTLSQTRICKNETVILTPTPISQDSLSVIKYIYGDGQQTIDSIWHNPVYKRMRYELPNDSTITSSVDITASTSPDSVYSISHKYSNRSKYRLILKLTNTSGCTNTKSQIISVGEYVDLRINNSIISDFSNVAVCSASEINFDAGLYYWHPIGPLSYPWDYDTTRYWLDPTQGGKRTQPAGGYETFEWDFGDGSAVSKKYFEKHSYANAGKYTVELRFKDSTGCVDTVRRVVYINKPVADFGLSSLVSICSKPINLTNKSFFISACGSKSCQDSIMKFLWSDNGKFFSQLENPNAVPKANGNHDLKLEITTANGCLADTTITIRAISPSPKFSVLSDTIGYAPFKAKFKNLSDSLTNMFGWLVDGQGSSFSMNNEYTFTQPGDYDIKLVGTGQLYDSLAGAFVNCTVTYPMPPEKAVTIHVLAPNKVTDVVLNPHFKLYRLDENNLSLNWEDEKVNRVEVYDMFGRQFQWHKSISANQQLISTEGMAKGVYLLNIQTDKGRYTKKILVY